MASFTNIADAVWGLRTQVFAQSFASGYARERCRGVAVRLGDELAALGANTTNISNPASSSLGDALNGLRLQVSAASWPSTYVKLKALSLCETCSAELAAQGLAVGT